MIFFTVQMKENHVNNKAIKSHTHTKRNKISQRFWVPRDCSRLGVGWAVEEGQKHCHMGEYWGQGLAEGCGRFSIIDYGVSFQSHLKTLHPVMQAKTEKMWTGISQEYLRYWKSKS